MGGRSGRSSSPPVPGARVTSAFGYRLHPLRHRRVFHKGVDLAAPLGTPVRASAEGVVLFAGWQRGYGRVVVLRHDRHRTTLYAHLGRFARGLRRGRRVQQGEVIGYVGRSGHATGPHLHYELQIDGVPHDLLKALQLASRPLLGFQSHLKRLLEKLSRPTQMARIFSPKRDGLEL